MSFADDARAKARECSDQSVRLRNCAAQVQHHLSRVDWQSVANDKYQSSANRQLCALNSSAENLEHLTKLYYAYSVALDEELAREIAKANQARMATTGLAINRTSVRPIMR
jgi:hypothetical protein